jgi:transposase
MQTVYGRCCGIDVHKKIVVACYRNGRKAELRKFDTLPASIKELGNWLLQNGCQMVAMECTGPYWKSIYNILELLNLDVIVVNAHHMKNVPGRNDGLNLNFKNICIFIFSSLSTSILI